jgi:hypothetical protein
MREGIGQQGQWFFTATEKVYGDLGSDEKFSLL